MFSITSRQNNIFKSHSLGKFEDQMVAHVQDFFPSHFAVMTDEGARKTIRQAYKKASIYGYDSKRNVCLFLNNMLLLGSSFDTDPQYPWVQAILTTIKEPNDRSSIDELAAKTLDFIKQITGLNNLHLNRALVSFRNMGETLFKEFQSKNIESDIGYLKHIFPAKYDHIGDITLRLLINSGKLLCSKYNVEQEKHLTMIVVFMFLLGHGFDSDPQFPWIKEIVDDNVLLNSQDIWAKTVLNETISRLDKFLYN